MPRNILSVDLIVSDLEGPMELSRGTQLSFPFTSISSATALNTTRQGLRFTVYEMVLLWTPDEVDDDFNLDDGQNVGHCDEVDGRMMEGIYKRLSQPWINPDIHEVSYGLDPQDDNGEVDIQSANKLQASTQ